MTLMAASAAAVVVAAAAAAAAIACAADVAAVALAAQCNYTLKCHGSYHSKGLRVLSTQHLSQLPPHLSGQEVLSSNNVG